MIASLLLLFTGCTGPADDTAPEETKVELDTAPPTVSDADLTGVDEQLFVDSVALILTVSANSVWGAIDASLARGNGSSCPDVYLGTPNPNEVDFEGVDDDFDGWSWYDYCRNGSTRIGGGMFWDTELVTSIDKGDTLYEGQRSLVSAAWVGTDDETFVQFDGDLDDSLRMRVAPGGGKTVEGYSMSFDGIVGGSDLFADATGWRSTLEFDYQPGSFSIIGNLFMFEQVVDGRFDAWSYQLEEGDTTCAKEPEGWLAVRAIDGFWFELDYETPLDYGDTGKVPDTDPYAACDGCGTLYVRGIDQLERQEVGVLCPDFSTAWSGIATPQPEDFLYPPR